MDCARAIESLVRGRSVSNFQFCESLRADNGDLPDGYTPPAEPAQLEEALRVVS